MVDLLTPQHRDVSNSDRGEPSIRLKRAYEPPSLEDGKRILVDRLWPRGICRTDAAIDCWLKEIAPSSDLRRWFGHDPGRWGEFQNRYRRELLARPEILNKLRALADQGPLTFAYTRSAKTAAAIAASVETGMISINHHGLALPEVPFGGVKDSGYGSEGGSEAIEAYLNTKFVSQAGL